MDLPHDLRENDLDLDAPGRRTPELGGADGDAAAPPSLGSHSRRASPAHNDGSDGSEDGSEDEHGVDEQQPRENVRQTHAVRGLGSRATSRPEPKSSPALVMSIEDDNNESEIDIISSQNCCRRFNTAPINLGTQRFASVGTKRSASTAQTEPDETERKKKRTLHGRSLGLRREQNDLW